MRPHNRVKPHMCHLLNRYQAHKYSPLRTLSELIYQQIDVHFYKWCKLLFYIPLFHVLYFSLAGATGVEPAPAALETALYGFAYHYSFHYLPIYHTCSLWSGVRLHLAINV